MDTSQAITVHCQLCPDLAEAATDLFAGLDLAGTHDDALHDGGTTAYVHVPEAAPKGEL